MAIKIERAELYPNIISLRFRNQYETCATFMRLQEFYESPFKGIRGKLFTLEQYMDRYAKETGNFTYTTDWGGFNVPGHIVRSFFGLFTGTLLEKEKALRDKLQDDINGTHKFYVIGHYEETNKLDWTADGTLFSTLAHEVAHGLFYLNDEYRKLALALIKNMPKREIARMEKKLLTSGGYCRAVLKDEIQAYLGTSSEKYLKGWFGSAMKDTACKFRGLVLDTLID